MFLISCLRIEDFISDNLWFLARLSKSVFLPKFNNSTDGSAVNLSKSKDVFVCCWIQVQNVL